MKFYIAIFVFLAFSSGVSADVPDCPGPFNPPNNISTQVVYPVSDSLVTFPTGYNCVYQINVPPGWSSHLVVTVFSSSNTTSAPIVQIIDFNQKVENYTSYRWFQKYYFIAPGGKIKLSTQSANVTFQFSVQWYSSITVYQPTFLNVSASDSQPSMVNVSYVNCRVTAETRVSVITMPLDDNWLTRDQADNLRSVLIFDGPNENSTCLGTAYQLWNSNRQFVSTGKTLTIVQLQPLPYVSRSQMLIQDFENTKEIGQYRGVGSLGDRPIVMDASKQAAAFSTYSDAGSSSDCLLNITGTGTLNVYYGGKTDSKSNLIASYSASSNSLNLPQKIRGVVRTYVLTGGIATVQIELNSACNKLTKNVAGFITSPEYKTNLTLPYTSDSQHYYSDGPFKYTFTVQDVDLSQNKSLQISIYNKQTSGFVSVVYNSSNPPILNTVFSGVGNEMDVIYSSPNSNAKKGGFYIDFTATKTKESAAKFFGVIVICAIISSRLF
ncbi:hypothetical protein B9Z55_000255 [Caenorhabditis nigoni]|uniref:Uncharacterized protein n=1 Tax=Caenorhabditis nigoni TaxID=1611254 RepID=A0A2G5VKY7_9PELO|nr:hypothetical protein B9Z55_000255 [Caenorhabditis nigoni]